MKQIIRGDLHHNVGKIKPANFVTHQTFYHYDLTGDNKTEIIIPSKRDGSDWITIKSESGEVLFENKLQAYGLGAFLYKIKITQLKSGVIGIIFFYMSGETNWLEQQKTARLYLLSYDHGKFGYKLFPAAHISIEKDAITKQYWRRQMNVESVDLDANGTREIVISYGQVQHVFFYKGNGGWRRL